MQLGDLILSSLDRLGPLPYTLEDITRAVLPKIPAGRVLADVEKETLRLMAEVLLEDCPVKISTTEVAECFERFLIKGKSRRAWRCRVLLTIVEYAPILAYGKPVHRLSLEERRRFVREKLLHAERQPWTMCAKVRYLAYAGAYGHTAANAATGFVPFEDRPRARASAPAVEEVRHEA